MNLLRYLTCCLTLIAGTGFSAHTFAAEPTAAELKTAIDNLNKATQELKTIRTELDKIKTLETSVLDIKNRLIPLESTIAQLQLQIDDLKSEKKSSSLKPDDKTSSSFKGMGRFRLINDFVEEQSILVNGLSYRLLPGEERVIPVNPGEFTYQVLQLQRTPQVRKIAQDEIKTVRIYPVN